MPRVAIAIFVLAPDVSVWLASGSDAAGHTGTLTTDGGRDQVSAC